ncbi:MAG: PilZ domain-containing protein [Deltaproteobacteria bacterium]
MAFSFDARSPEDRRRWPRLRTYAPVKYRFLKEDRFLCCITSDISEGGVGLLVDDPLPCGACLYFQLKLRNAPQPAYGIARVAWTSKDPFSKKYRAGLEFIEINSGSRTEIASFVHDNSPHPRAN